MSLNLKFGTDGWRGVMGDDFSFEQVEAIGQKLADYFIGKDVLWLIGYDRRISPGEEFRSEDFAERLAQVFTGNGFRVMLADRPAPTTTIFYLAMVRQAIAIVITASHNPGKFNGLKPRPYVPGVDLIELATGVDRSINQAGGWSKVEVKKATIKVAQEKKLIQFFNPEGEYFNQMAKLVNLDQIKKYPLKIVIDDLYGSGVNYLSHLLSGGKIKVKEIHTERVTNFNGLHPEPIPPHISQLQDEVKKEKADLGIALDGDADRIGPVDEHGQFVDQLHTYLLLLDYQLVEENLRGPIIRTLSSTFRAERLAQKYGLEVIETPVGFKYVGPEFLKNKAIFGGEESGGYCFPDHINERDAILAALKIIDLVGQRKKPLSQIMSAVEERVGGQFYFKRIDVELPREGYDDKRERFYGSLLTHLPREILGVKITKTRTDDGFKFILGKDSSVLLRFSGNEPLLRIYVESSTKELLEKLLKWGEAFVKEKIAKGKK